MPDLRDELAEAIYGALSGSFGDFGGNHSRRAADALLPIIEAHEAEVREQIAARLEGCQDTAYGLSKTDKDETRAQRRYASSCAFGVAARIVRGQA